MSITFTMIKPGAVEHNFTGPILGMINEAGFRIKALRMTHMDDALAREFYRDHKGKMFFEGLIEYMTSGPIVAAILEKEQNAVIDFRNLLGATDPAFAEKGTIRKLFAESLSHNAVHGSDSNENAIREAAFFFNDENTY